MKRTISTLVAACVLAAPVWADEALAKKKQCMACHAIDKKLVGPAYKDIAAKYASQNATAKLTGKVIKGGAGVWGAIPMPENTQISQTEADTLVRWILSLK